MTTDRESDPSAAWIRNEAPSNAAPTSAPGTSSGSSHAAREASAPTRGAPMHVLTTAFERAFAGNERLGDLHWFRTDWQRGGAATASARYRQRDGTDAAAIVKVPVTLRELRWSRRLGAAPDGEAPGAASGDVEPPVARLLEFGTELGPYDFAWVVLERIPHGPMALDWHPNTVARIADAAARFHQGAARIPVDESPTNEDWEALVRSAREHVRDPAMPERSRWSNALKEFSRRLDKAMERWSGRTPIGWIHGDLHPANAVTRQTGVDAPACLIDLAEVRAGHWLEDAVYLERLLWTRPERLAQRPVKAIADARKRLGLENGDYPLLASVRRLLLAATTPAFRGEHNHVLLAASLARLEEGMKDIR